MKNKKTLLAIIIIFIIITLSLTINHINNNINNYNEYVSEEMGVSLRYPNDWIIGFDDENYNSLHSEKGDLSLTISGSYDNFSDYEELLEFCKKEFEKTYPNQKIEVKFDKIDGRKCLSAEYILSHNDRELVSKSYFVISENKNMTIYLTFSKEEEFDFSNIINSIKIF